MSQLILALGSVSANGSSVRIETKEAVTEHRQSLLPGSLNSLVFVVQASELPTVYDSMELAGWVPLLTKDGTVEFRIMGDGDVAPIHVSLLLAGLKATSELRDVGGVRILTAQRKAKTETVSQPLKFATEPSTEEEDLIDEDDLLNDTTLGTPSMTPRTVAGDDCSGRKPCDNCSCGRAEAEAAAPNPALTKEEIVKKASACGNCAKGDAFRCASCPFLGKPAFKPGQEHVVLDLVDDF